MTLCPEQLDEPEPSLSAQDEYDELEQRRSERREELLAESMGGVGGFWSLEDWDQEQAQAMFATLGRICAQESPLIGTQQAIGDALCWQKCRAEIRKLATEYAVYRATEEIT